MKIHFPVSALSLRFFYSFNQNQFHPVSSVTPQSWLRGGIFHFHLQFTLSFPFLTLVCLLIWSSRCDQPPKSPVGSPLPGSAPWLTLGIAGCFWKLTLLFIPAFSMWAHQHISLLTTSDSKHWNRSLESRPMIVFSASLPELGPVARLSGRGLAHSGTCWTWRICLFDKRAASAPGSWHLFGPVVFCSAESTRGQVGIWRESR